MATDRAFAGHTVVITGTSSGIGKSLARTLAIQGARVGLIARRQPALEELAGEIREAGGNAAWAVADVGDRAALHRAVDALIGELGPVDLMIANAGVGVPTTLEPINIDAIEETIRVNVMGVIYAIEATLPSMLARGSGQIAAISSLAAYKGMPGESAYCASKAAVNAYMEGLRVQVRGRGVAISTICPGFIHTPMTQSMTVMPFALTADQAAERIVRAIARKVKVYNFPRRTAALMWITRLMPDWVLALGFRDHLKNPPMPEGMPSVESREV